jgi:hypothetical protein
LTGSVPPSAHEVPDRVIERIWTNVDVGGENECWPWKLSLGTHGYGQVGWWVKSMGRSVMTTAHRVVWIASVGPIPAHMTVDHECRNPRCCNPGHLRLKTNPENARDNRQAMRGPGRRSYKEVG